MYSTLLIPRKLLVEEKSVLSLSLSHANAMNIIDLFFLIPHPFMFLICSLFFSSSFSKASRKPNRSIHLRVSCWKLNFNFYLVFPLKEWRRFVKEKICNNCSEWKKKEIIEDNDKDDTVTFDMKNTFIFRSDLTAKESGLTGNEVVTIPHLIIMVSSQ